MFFTRLRTVDKCDTILSAMRTVIFVKGSGNYPDRMKQAGITEYAQQNKWNLFSVEPLNTQAELKDVIDLWSPSGFIISCGGGLNTLPPSAYGKIPAVFFTVPDKNDTLPICRVYNDTKMTAHLAAKTLLMLNLKSYGYINWFTPLSWNESRRQHFQDILAIHGKRLASFSTHLKGSTQFTKALIPWLRALSTPVGLFAANDIVARLTADACKLAGLSVPDDIAIVSVDNDVELCEGASPSLTSIPLDHVESGRLAARLLDRMMNKCMRRPVDITYPCAEVIHRESTRRFDHSDRIISEIAERIRKEACNGLSAADVVKGYPCSRRVIEIRFRKATGRSILEEIRKIRLQRAIELLRNPNLVDMSAVAHQSGYETLQAFSAFFKSETGLSPHAWQKSQRGKHRKARRRT